MNLENFTKPLEGDPNFLPDLHVGDASLATDFPVGKSVSGTYRGIIKSHTGKYGESFIHALERDGVVINFWGASQLDRKLEGNVDRVVDIVYNGLKEKEDKTTVHEFTVKLGVQ